MAAISLASRRPPSRSLRSYGEWNAFSMVTCWSSSMPMSSASGSPSSRRSASGSPVRGSLDAIALNLGSQRRPFGGLRGSEGGAVADAELHDEGLQGDGPALVIRTVGIGGYGLDEVTAEEVPRQPQALDESHGQGQRPRFPRRREDQLAVVARKGAGAVHEGHVVGQFCSQSRCTPIMESRVTTPASSSSVIPSVPAGRSGRTR